MILALRVSGAPAEVWVHHLDARGVVVGAGSACQANKRELSPTLLAAGLAEGEARQVLRISTDASTTPEELERALEVLTPVADELTRL